MVTVSKMGSARSCFERTVVAIADLPAGGGEGRRRAGRNGQEHRASHRDTDPSNQGMIRRANVGKGHLPAGADDNLQRLSDQGIDRRRREDFGLAHESVRAMKEG